MLKWRVITALVLAPPVFAMVWYAPTPWLAGAFGIVILLASAEWAALVPLRSRAGRATYVAAHLAVLVLAWLALGQGDSPATALLAAAEWAALVPLRSGAGRASYVAAHLAVLVLAWLALGHGDSPATAL
ncbi:MAG TPA: phosphatidate cytidylyltransferase, partial [Pseudohaliea sp.]|nr:phosphatidate cytidylyltransferase [Pseudohaliea sp.]